MAYLWILWLFSVARQSNPIAMPLVNPKKKEKKKGYENSGVLNIDLKVDETNYSFLDYLQTGVQLHFTVAIGELLVITEIV